MEYWLAWFHEANEQAKQVAMAAERMGFAGVAVSDHLAIPTAYTSVHPSGERHIEPDTVIPECLITMATMAAVTTRLRLMSYVYVLPMREPFSVAKQAATLAMQSDYRLLLGVGTGWNVDEIQLLGHNPHRRGRRTDEMITIMRDLWDDGFAAFEGEFYRFDTAAQFPVPREPIPVLIGGKSPGALRRAARNDGWAGMKYTMGEIRGLVAALNAERRRYVDAHGEGRIPFRRYVMPDALPSHDVFHQLEDWGFDGVVVMVWWAGDPQHASLEAKLDAMQRFANQYITG